MADFPKNMTRDEEIAIKREISLRHVANLDATDLVTFAEASALRQAYGERGDEITRRWWNRMSKAEQREILNALQNIEGSHGNDPSTG